MSNSVNGFAARRQSGALLLTVSLLLAIMAALAFGLSRGAGMGAHAVMSDYDRRSAAYLAQAAVAAAKWTDEVGKCVSPPAIGPLSLAGGTASATITSVKGGITVTANASTANGAAVTLTGVTVPTVDLVTNPESKNTGGMRDTTITYAYLLPQNTNKTLWLSASGYVPSYALLFWPLNDFPANSQILSATLTLVQSAPGGLARTVSVQRMTTAWDVASATWLRARSNPTSVGWNGGDYAGSAAASASVGGAATVTWNVTGLVDSWVRGVLPNDGMLLRLPSGGQDTSFYSFEASDGSVRPVLSISFAKACP